MFVIGDVGTNANIQMLVMVNLKKVRKNIETKINSIQQIGILNNALHECNHFGKKKYEDQGQDSNL